MNKAVKRLTRRHRFLLLDSVQNPRSTMRELSARHGYSLVWTSTLINRGIGLAFAMECEDRIIAESIKASAILPNLAAFQAMSSLPSSKAKR